MSESLKYDESNIENVRFSSDEPLEGCEFHGIDFTKINLKAAGFLDCRFISCNFANQSFLNASIRDVSFESCNMLGVNWCLLKRVENLKFVDSKLNLSSFQDLKLKHTKILNCSAIEVDFSGADLTDSDFSGSNFSGSNFSEAILNGVDFRSSREYLFDIRKAKIKKAKFSLPDVLALVTVLGAEVEY